MQFPERLENTPFTHIPFYPGKQWSDLSYLLIWYVCNLHNAFMVGQQSAKLILYKLSGYWKNGLIN